jgi:hypothetical protein
MPSTILSTLLGQPLLTITDETTGNAIWTDLGIVDIEVSLSSENTNEPLSNQQISDSSTYESILAADVQSVKIISPSRLRITALCSDLSTVKGIIATFADTSATMSISTKSIVTRYLCMSEVDIDQTAEMISAVRIVMVFEQAQPTESTGFAPEQAADESVYGVTLTNPPSVVPLATLTKAIASATSFIPTIASGALIDNLGGPFILDSSKLS